MFIFNKFICVVLFCSGYHLLCVAVVFVGDVWWFWIIILILIRMIIFFLFSFFVWFDMFCHCLFWCALGYWLLFFGITIMMMTMICICCVFIIVLCLRCCWVLFDVFCNNINDDADDIHWFALVCVLCCCVVVCHWVVCMCLRVVLCFFW